MTLVIDWEFTGYKPEIYDAANLVGCIGVENPDALSGDLVKDFIKSLRKENIFADISWNFFIEFIVSLRFAWLSEWLRHDDKDMIKLETDYMNLLVDNAIELKKIWDFN